MREFVRIVDELEDEGGGGGVLRYLRRGGLGLGGTSMFLLFQTDENVKKIQKNVKRETSSTSSAAQKKNKKKVSVAKCQKKNRQK